MIFYTITGLKIKELSIGLNTSPSIHTPLCRRSMASKTVTRVCDLSRIGERSFLGDNTLEQIIADSKRGPKLMEDPCATLPMHANTGIWIKGKSDTRIIPPTTITLKPRVQSGLKRPRVANMSQIPIIPPTTITPREQSGRKQPRVAKMSQLPVVAKQPLSEPVKMIKKKAEGWCGAAEGERMGIQGDTGALKEGMDTDMHNEGRSYDTHKKIKAEAEEESMHAEDTGAESKGNAQGSIGNHMKPKAAMSSKKQRKFEEFKKQKVAAKCAKTATLNPKQEMKEEPMLETKEKENPVKEVPVPLKEERKERCGKRGFTDSTSSSSDSEDIDTKPGGPNKVSKPIMNPLGKDGIPVSPVLAPMASMHVSHTVAYLHNQLSHGVLVRQNLADATSYLVDICNAPSPRR